MQPLQRWQQSIKTSLRAKLLLFLSLSMLSILVIAAYGVFRYIETVEQEGWAGRQREAAQYAVRTIDDFLLRVEDTLSLVGALSVQQIRQSPELLPEILNRIPAWIEIVRVDASGRVIASTSRDQSILTNLATIPLANWFQQARKGNNYLSPLFITATSEPYIILSMPASDGGVVAGRLRMNLLWETVATIRFGRTGHAYIVDDLGFIIAHPDPQVVLANTSISERPEFRTFPPDGNQRFYINRFQQETLGVALNIPGTSWRLLAEIPEDEATELSTRAGIVVTISLFLFGALILLSINYLLDRFIFRVLDELRQGAERVGSGDLTHPLVVPPEYELAQVASAFNTMMHQLHARNLEIARQTESLKTEIQQRRRIEQELIRARDAAEAASRAKSTFLATMSHELRTPLTAIIGYSQLLEQLISQGIYDTVAHDVGRIRAAGTHLLSLINDILDISRIEAGRMTVSIEYADVADLVYSAVNTVLPQIEKNRNHLQINCPPDIGILNSDATKVRQALINLLSNAAKFTEDGEITLTVSHYYENEQKWFRFAVTDTGIGIPADKLDKLFKAFSQVDDTPTRKYGGTGLGLALSQRLCALIGGRITVESTVGVGSTFTIEVPAELNAISPTSELDAPNLSALPVPITTDSTTSTVTARNAVLLIIDDDPTMSDMLRRLIPATEATIVTAETGAEGLQLAAALIPEVIVLDLKLPDLHGLEVLARLRENPELSHIPIVVLTIDDQAQHGLTLSVDEYLVKPVEPNRLISTVRRFYQPKAEVLTPYILLVEDDPALAELFAQNLRTVGWSVEVAFDGETGLTAALSRPPALMLLDYMLPGMDGLQLLEQLRSHPHGKNIPVILMTAHELTADERQQLAASVSMIQRKAELNLEQMIDHLRRLLSQNKPLLSNKAG